MRYLVFAAYLVLALAVVLPFAGGTWILLRIRQTQSMVKQKIDSGAHAETLMVLDISKEEENAGNGIFIRIHSAEFIYHGQMYDVVSVHDLGRMKRYLVFPDYRETRLKRKLARKMEQNGAQPLSKSLERISTLHWLAELPQISIQNPFTGNHFYTNQSFITEARFIMPKHLPPDVSA